MAEPHTDRCNCPPMRDVLRGVVGTKPECPVHPTPPNLADVLRPAISRGEMRSNAFPLAPDEEER